LTPRRFPPPWSIEELNDACFVVRDANGQQLAYVYFEDEPGRQSAAKLPRRDEAPICAGILCATEPSRFPWTKGFDYDSDSIQYSLDFTLHALGLGFQEFLQPSEFGHQFFELAS
jgi:hypothetical protein